MSFLQSQLIDLWFYVTFPSLGVNCGEWKVCIRCIELHKVIIVIARSSRLLLKVETLPVGHCTWKYTFHISLSAWKKNRCHVNKKIKKLPWIKSSARICNGQMQNVKKITKEKSLSKCCHLSWNILLTLSGSASIMLYMTIQQLQMTEEQF